MKITFWLFTVGVTLVISTTCALAQKTQECLIANYQLNKNVRDTSGNNYHGKTIGAVLTTDRFNNANAAYNFDGISSRIEINSNQAIITGSVFTVTAWAKMDGPGGGVANQNVIFEQRDDAASSSFVFHANRNGETQFTLRSSSSTSVLFATSKAPAYGEWHHYAAVLDSSKNMRLYIDGVEVAVTPFTQTGDFHSSIDYVDIGTHRQSGKIQGAFNGDIDDVRIYDCPLESMQIIELFEGNSDTCLVANYYLNNNTRDTSGNNYHGNVVGAELAEDRFGNSNSAYSFGGDGDRIELNSNQPIITGSVFTVSAWAKMEGPGGGVANQNVIFEQRDNAASSSFVFHANRNGETQFTLRSSSSTSVLFATSKAPAYGGWHHYAAVLDSSKNMRLYIDGEEVAVTPFTQTGDFHSSIDYVDIGTHRQSGKIQGAFNGSIDDVKIYNCALTSAEIAEQFKQDTTTSVHETALTDDPKIIVYPNPAHDHLNIQIDGFNGSKAIQVSIYNSLGQQVQADVLNPESVGILMLSGLPPGVYVVRCLIGKQQHVKRIIIL